MFKKFVWIITILWMGIIFYFSSQPAYVSRQESGDILAWMDKIEENEVQDTDNARVSKLQYNIRKFAHFIMYSGLGFLITISIVLIKYKSFASYVLAWLATAVYAVLDEFHQSFVPGRGATLVDIKIDCVSAFVGVVMAVIVIEMFKLIKKRRKQMN